MQSTSLATIYERFSTPDGGGDKGTQHSYIDVYGAEIDQRDNVALLEIGVWQGHSLAMWGEYLNDSTVIGLDIDLSRCQFEVDARLCDATDPNDVVRTLGDALFDYIIDDGSHRVMDQVNALLLLWERVKPGGKYFIEDIASDEALAQIVAAVDSLGAQFVVHDLRELKNRYDDILIVITRD